MASTNPSPVVASSTLEPPATKQKSSSRASSPDPAAGLLDLEKELTCSICTDILYQPLTLLDCLHTFCGSCLKEWFSWQAAAAKQKRRQEGRSSSSPSSLLYTCPSCRAGVRETRPNATVTTLLDMYLQANPTRGKTEDEKKEVAMHFKVGESVLPAPPSPPPATRDRRQRDDPDEEDRRLMDEVRQMSLRELERRGTRASRGEGERRRDERNRRRDEMLGTASATAGQSTPLADPRRERPDPSPRPPEQERGSPRSLEHQSSLRSLISSSDLESQEMEEEIMRQIMEEGLLDGIDLSNIDRNDEDEISERIAQAYRRRQRDRERERETLSRREPAQTSRNEVREAGAGPPSSFYPRRAVALPNARSRHRSSSQGSSSSARIVHQGRSSLEDTSRTLTRPSQDPPYRTEASTANVRQQRQVRLQERRSQERTLTGAETLRSSARWNTTSNNSTSLGDTAQNGNAEHNSYHDSPGTVTAAQNSTNVSLPANSDSQLPNTVSQTSTPRSPRAAESHSTRAAVAPFRYCSSCTRPRIQYELHYTCSKCLPTSGSNKFALCQRCYRMGKGCSHWFGFGQAAWTRFRQQVPYDRQADVPHVLTPERYINASSAGVADGVASHHQEGLFCDVCSENANECYWRCDVCNEGEWGFCNKCVNQERHCTHPVLPLGWGLEGTSSSPQSSPAANLTPLPVHTSCNVCGNPIPPSTSRFHCPYCNDGDYDICTSCYRSSVLSGRIAPENGPQGWRKCENGHRMVIIGFESRPDGQRRVVLESVIGGWQMREEDAHDSPAAGPDVAAGGQGNEQLDSASHWSWRDPASGGWKHKRGAASQSAEAKGSLNASHATHFTPNQGLPPSGGFGFKMNALWTRLPDEGVEDELVFPKWAEITEVVDINEDWCWGVYCKSGGLFPEAFGRVVK